MTGWERRALGSLVAAVLPSPGSGIPAAADLDLGPFYREVAARFPPLARLGLRAAVIALTLGPLVFLGRLTTFARLAPDERERMLARVATSRHYLVRQLAQLVKTVACLGYLRVPSVRSALGLDR